MIHKTFLRRLAADLFIIAMFCGTLFILTSCDKRPECEKLVIGETSVENKTGFPLFVDCSYNLKDINSIQLIVNNDQFSYTMAAGDIYIWASFDDEDWVYDTYLLDPCEHLVYTWYLDEKKSTSPNWWENLEIVYIDKNGEEIIRRSLNHYGKRR